jgi:hypothetical protein
MQSRNEFNQLIYAIAHSKCPTTLDLSSQAFNNNDFKKLAKALSLNQNIREINLENNNLNTANTKLLLATLTFRSKDGIQLCDLNLRNNGLTDDITNSLIELYEMNITCVIHLSNNKLSNNALKALHTAAHNINNRYSSLHEQFENAFSSSIQQETQLNQLESTVVSDLQAIYRQIQQDLLVATGSSKAECKQQASNIFFLLDLQNTPKNITPNNFTSKALAHYRNEVNQSVASLQKNKNAFLRLSAAVKSYQLTLGEKSAELEIAQQTLQRIRPQLDVINRILKNSTNEQTPLTLERAYYTIANRLRTMATLENFPSPRAVKFLPESNEPATQLNFTYSQEELADMDIEKKQEKITRFYPKGM